MSNNIQSQVIIMSLQPLFERAEADNQWFYHNSDDAGEVWASPGYLKKEQSEGRLLWSPEHWELRSPIDYMAGLHRKAGALIDEYNEMAELLRVPHVLLMEKQDMKPGARVGWIS